jgi:hypothetical protein
MDITSENWDHVANILQEGGLETMPISLLPDGSAAITTSGTTYTLSRDNALSILGDGKRIPQAIRWKMKL